MRIQFYFDVNRYGSCTEQLRRIHPELRNEDLNYVCSARSTIRVDSNPRFTQCVIYQAQYSNDGEFIINSCR